MKFCMGDLGRNSSILSFHIWTAFCVSFHFSGMKEFVLRINRILSILKFISGISGSKTIIDEKFLLRSDYKLLMNFHDLQHD